MRDLTGLIPWADPGPARAGPGWELTGLALAQTNPIVPRVARTNPAWDQSGLAIWDVQCIQCKATLTQHVQSIQFCHNDEVFSTSYPGCFAYFLSERNSSG